MTGLTPQSATGTKKTATETHERFPRINVHDVVNPTTLQPDTCYGQMNKNTSTFKLETTVQIKSVYPKHGYSRRLGLKPKEPNKTGDAIFYNFVRKGQNVAETE